MAATPDRDLPAKVQATIKAAESRADEAWAQLQQRGPSYGAHPLSELLKEGDSQRQSGVA